MELLWILLGAVFGVFIMLMVTGGLSRITSTTDEIIQEECTATLHEIVDYVDFLDEEELLSSLQNVKQKAKETIDWCTSFRTSERRGVIILEMLKHPDNPVTTMVVLHIANQHRAWPDDFNIDSITKSFRYANEQVKL